MHPLHITLVVAFAVAAVAVPVLRPVHPKFAVSQDELPPDCPDYCDCSRYEDDPEG